MKARRAGAALVVLAVAGSLVALVAHRTERKDAAYTVRAIFDNAGFAAEGEDVKVAGAVVGRIGALDVTPDRKAVVNLRISDRRFTPFHADARCTVRSEGLLAVKFVDCDPGTGGAPRLDTVTRGDGAGTHLLPVTRTSSPVDLDLVTSMLRRPQGQELALLLSELGTGLAGRGTELNAVIHRAAPALGQANAVLARLARQNRALDAFADDADRVLVPLAGQRRQLAGFVRRASTAAAASAGQADALGAGVRRLPAFLAQLRTTMGQLEAMAQATTPVLAELRSAAPALDRTTTQLARFAGAATPAVRTTGELADRAGPDLVAARPFASDLDDLGRQLQPAASDLDALTAAYESKQGIQRTTELIYNAANAVNGYDAVGHYARVEFLSSACSEYTAKGFFGCDAQWGPTASTAKPITGGAAIASAATRAVRDRDRGGARPVAASEAALLDYLVGP